MIISNFFPARIHKTTILICTLVRGYRANFAEESVKAKTTTTKNKKN